MIMKIILYFISFFFITLNDLESSEIKLDTHITPPGIESPVEKRDVNTNLDNLLKQGDLLKFYEQLSEAFQELNQYGVSDYSRETVNWGLWLIYYAVAAPLIAVDHSGTVACQEIESKDFGSKCQVVERLYWLRYFKDDEEKRPVGSREYRLLAAEWSTKVVKQLRDYYLDKDFPPKAARLKEEYKKQMLAESGKNGKAFAELEGVKDHDELSAKWKLLEKERVAIQRKYALLKRGITVEEAKRRHVGRNLESIEKRFVELLVLYFPGKGTEVKKYLKQAGYDENEMFDLINTTVGRNSKTEFLYKGEFGKKHDKLTKSK